MKLKLILLSGAVVAASAVFASAATITVNVSALSDGVAANDGSPLASGTGFGIGFFTTDGTSGGTVLTDVDIANLGTGAALDAAFVEFGAGQYEVGAGASLDGLVSDSFAGDNAGFVGQSIYAYFNVGGEVGVFKNVNGGGDLEFPTGADIFTDTANFGFDTTSAPASAIIIGSYDPTNANPTLTVGGSFELAAIPEPSAAALLLGSIGIIMLRRRRSRS